MNEPCSRKGCPKNGLWHPVMLLRAPLDYGETPPVRAVIGLKVCDDHKFPDPKEWITDEGWAQIEAGFRSQSFVIPDRGRVQIEFTKELPPGFSANGGRITR